jgi:hypothetical protein
VKEHIFIFEHFREAFLLLNWFKQYPLQTCYKANETALIKIIILLSFLTEKLYFGCKAKMYFVRAILNLSLDLPAVLLVSESINHQKVTLSYSTRTLERLIWEISCVRTICMLE